MLDDPSDESDSRSVLASGYGILIARNAGLNTVGCGLEKLWHGRGGDLN